MKFKHLSIPIHIFLFLLLGEVVAQGLRTRFNSQCSTDSIGPKPEVIQSLNYGSNSASNSHITPQVGLWTGAFGNGLASDASVKRSKNSGVVYFSETWGSGFSGDGTNGVWTNSGEVNGVPNSNAIWEFRGPNTTPSNAVGSRGAFTQGNLIISPTVANGFMIFDSDYLTNGGSQGGVGTAPTPHRSWLESSSFSTIGSSQISIKVNVYFRRYLGTAYILLSNDNGATWGDSITIMDENWPVNIASPVDLVINEDVSYIQNTSTAKIAFFFDGQTLASPNGSGFYHVQIDDIEISKEPVNDLTLDRVWYNNSQDLNAFGYYSRIPSVFATSDSAIFSADISNSGLATQTNVSLVNKIMTPIGSSVVSSSPISLAADSSNLVVTETPFVFDQGVGTYAWSISVESDSIDDFPSNNVIDTVFIEITDSIYSRDRNASGNFNYGVGNAYEIGIRYDIYDTIKLTSISVAFGTGSNVGAGYSVHVYDENLNVPIVSKGYISINAGEPGNLITIDLDDTLLVPGVYYATFKVYSDEITFPSSDYEPINDQAVVNINSTNFGNADRIPVIRLNVSDDLINSDLVGLVSGRKKVVTLFPNPTNGEMNIKLQDVEAGAYQISVMNMVGQTINVRTVNVSGNQVINLGDLNLTNGMYFVEVSNSNEEKSVIRVIVK